MSLRILQINKIQFESCYLRNLMVGAPESICSLLLIYTCIRPVPAFVLKPLYTWMYVYNSHGTNSLNPQQVCIWRDCYTYVLLLTCDFKEATSREYWNPLFSFRFLGWYSHLESGCEVGEISRGWVYVKVFVNGNIGFTWCNALLLVMSFSLLLIRKQKGFGY